MVGLFISMLCILATFTLFKTVGIVTREGQLDNLYDGQLASAMLMSQLQIQNAGYGIDNADASDIVKIETAKTTDDDHITKLVWRYKHGGTVYCEGIEEKTVTITLNGENFEYRQLASVNATSDCTEAANLADLTFNQVNVLARWQKLGALNTYLEANDKLFTFELTAEDCSPFGTAAMASHLTINITAPSSTSLNTNSGDAVNNLSICLANTYPS